jgi:hypothetical protein
MVVVRLNLGKIASTIKREPMVIARIAMIMLVRIY